MDLQASVVNNNVVLCFLICLITTIHCTVIGEDEFPLPCKMMITPASFGRAGSRINPWPNGRIPFTLDANFHAEATAIFHRAREEFHSKTCLRFEPKSSSDYNHIHMKLDYNTKHCGYAHLCRQEIGRQIVHISSKCMYLIIFIHELGHAACLDHEHVRPDRNEYLTFSECTNPSSIEPIDDRLTTRIQIYDYSSAMHYPCWTCIGLPTKEGTRKCGPDANFDGLTVVDADRLNEVYDCKGCHRHRWYRVDRLTSEQEASLVNFAEKIPGHEPTYLCRGFIKGNILTGIYIATEKACEVYLSYKSNKITDDIHVFGLSNGPTVITNTSMDYRLLVPSEPPSPALVAMGRRGGNTLTFATVRFEEEDESKSTVLLGQTQEILETIGYFAFKGEAKWFFQEDNSNKIEFYLIGCVQ